MEVFWFMKKVFFKKATCFLLILLMTMTSILSVCFASTYEGTSAGYKFVLAENVVLFDNSEDEIYVINLYNRLIKSSNDRKKRYYHNELLHSELVTLYVYIQENTDEVGSDAVSALDFLRYLAFKNGILLT